MDSAPDAWKELRESVYQNSGLDPLRRALSLPKLPGGALRRSRGAQGIARLTLVHPKKAGKFYNFFHCWAEPRRRGGLRLVLSRPSSSA